MTLLPKSLNLFNLSALIFDLVPPRLPATLSGPKRSRNRGVRHFGARTSPSFKCWTENRDIGEMQRTFRPPRLGDLSCCRAQADFVIACVLIALTLPLMTIVAIAIKCGSRGPVLVR